MESTYNLGLEGKINAFKSATLHGNDGKRTKKGSNDLGTVFWALDVLL